MNAVDLTDAVSNLSPELYEVLLEKLDALASARTSDHAHSDADLKEGLANADEEIERTRRDLPSSHEEHLESERQAYQAQRKVIFEKFDREYGTLREEYERLVHEANSAAEHLLKTEQRQLEESRWNAEAVYEAVKNEPARRFEEFKRQADAWIVRLRAEWELVLAQLQRWNLPEVAQVNAPPGVEPESQLAASERLNRYLADLMAGRERMAAMKLPSLAASVVPALAVLSLVAVASLLVAMFTRNIAAISIVAGIFLVAGVCGVIGLKRRARHLASEAFLPIAQTMAEAEAFLPQCIAEQNANRERKQQENILHRDKTIRDAEDHAATIVTESQRRRDALRDEYESVYPPQLQKFIAERDDAMRKLDDAHRGRMEELQKEFNTTTASAEDQYNRIREELRSHHAAEHGRIEEHWWSGVNELQQIVATVNEKAKQFFPEWHRLAEPDWQPPPATHSAMMLGTMTLGLKPPKQETAETELSHNLPVQPLEPTMTVPAVVPSPTQLSVLLETRGDGRRAATNFLQAYMLRLATSLPAAKCRFTIIDPVGLGENFAAFMHLADYDEQIISRRIWTDPRHIEQRLVDLSEHMENVIQKYLRNEFKSIDDYNHHAEEVAEPFRFLVIANFPANFTEAAARRLLSIAASGPRCGVFTLIAIDADQPMPAGFSLADLRQYATCLVWRGDRFMGREGLLAEFPLTVEEPPADELFTRILHQVGKHAQSAGRVEVPFEAICPPEDQYWTFSAKHGIDVPLGRAGATRLQSLKLGSGTSQHVLVAGKTGSGKSTLLHALVTSISLRYSPDEVELYLVDFKQGVEFKTYASHQLPHARVVAIESDREFGLSVLERLDVELRQRAEKFRDAEVQDLAGYRTARPEEPLPRVLLVVDEFQEFFTEDDRTAHEAGMLLDRLVRQGRAFGIHVLLGSQTLAGAYSLARSTLGQMAVRIALQCSEADAHLILSEDNTAARLLSRPGEAIYNDSNGLVEGNHPFQVVWLPDDRRDEYLDRAVERQKQSGQPSRPTLVFEGNVPADLEKNGALNALLSGDVDETPVPKVWLGDAVAIKDPTAVTFRTQSGSNLLIVGQDEAAALGITVSAMISVRAQQPLEQQPASPTAPIILLDGSQHQSVADTTFHRISELLPGQIKRASGRSLVDAVEELSLELVQRQQDPGIAAPAIFVFVFGLQTLRDLRKDDDDFGFSRNDKPASPAKQFASLLREGPAVGIHCIVWCDTLNNLNRAFDRQSLREFDQRVLLQMSAGDSSQLIDTPAASKLGANRALLADDTKNYTEKFRPYRVPSANWLDEQLTRSMQPR